ncbi:MAG TPA: endonuclease V [Solirubrobacteraceae bacterium]|nr:endonuclease V [Solirubrobacteraceae bacterium]
MAVGGPRTRRRWEALIEEQLALAAARPAPWRWSGEPLTIGGCAICFRRGLSGPGAAGDPCWAAAAVLCAGRVIGSAAVCGEAGAPYVPGLLAMREGPVLEAAVRALPTAPEVLLVDATGRDHPRRAGMAVALGATLGVPTVGVTHRPLLAVGDWPGEDRGAASPLVLEGETVGAWLRTRRSARPVAIHPAWRTDLEVAVSIVLSVSGRRRTPEPLRVARRLAREARAQAAR